MTDKLRPVTTLFLLISADGKISTGEGDSFDFDADLKTFRAFRRGCISITRSSRRPIFGRSTQGAYRPSSA